MDANFTDRLGKWLNTPEEQRDFAEGAKMLLQLTGNQFIYRAMMASPAGKMIHLDYQLRKFYNFRIQNVTHAQVVEMKKKAKEVVKKIEEKPAGKRSDHNELPPNVQALYVENASIRNRIRRLRYELDKLMETRSVCPDSDAYPFVKEIVELDIEYHENWEAYDKFSEGSGEDVYLASRKKESVNAARFIQTNKRHYINNPTDSLKEKLKERYLKIIAPSEELTKELIAIGVLDETECSNPGDTQ